ncbi:MAG: hypothetical protein F6K54_25800 [Okeania sp. SIO3B5]|uniref:hypothetical protein n=1 Tax=Okeania sp. SIO3B5 TaxID=2607811 RepID=UPI0013FFBF68|nr:hypothetical protein [Okeania sp. SIO3B5]NEO56191.1 hypothetical protein [Okeania sp. SIO3B5]
MIIKQNQQEQELSYLCVSDSYPSGSYPFELHGFDLLLPSSKINDTQERKFLIALASKYIPEHISLEINLLYFFYYVVLWVYCVVCKAWELLRIWELNKLLISLYLRETNKIAFGENIKNFSAWVYNVILKIMQKEKQ